MNDIGAYIIAFGIFGILILIGIFAFVIWLIKKGVQNAIEDTLYSKEFREQIRNDITYSIIIANNQLNNNTKDENLPD